MPGPRQGLPCAWICCNKNADMTPAIKRLKKANIHHRIHAYDHDPDSRAYGQEAARKLNVSADRLFKTLVVLLDDKTLSTAIVPVSRQLDLKAFARKMKAKKARMADKNEVERSTGYVLGGVSPMGQKKTLNTVIDRSALEFGTIYVSAGRRGLQIEMRPDDLKSQTRAEYAHISR